MVKLLKIIVLKHYDFLAIMLFTVLLGLAGFYSGSWLTVINTCIALILQIICLTMAPERHTNSEQSR